MIPISASNHVTVGLLGEPDREALLALLDRDRAGSLYLRSLVEEFGVAPGKHVEHGRFFGAGRDGRLDTVAFLGNSRNLTSQGRTSHLPAVLDAALGAPPGPGLFVGPADHAPVVRRAFARAGASPRLDREQAYYRLTPASLAGIEGIALRRAVPGDLEAVTWAQAEMTEEDLGIPSVQIDLRRLKEISRQRIDRGKVWVAVESGRLLFKTEEAARTLDGVLVGGVYTRPSERGKGYATRGIVSWARALFAEGLEMLTLHVNVKNRPAIGAYERVGFRRHSMLRLILGL